MNTTITDTKFLINLGLIIQKRRHELGLSQEELAWRCDMTKNGLGKIELGRSNLRLLTLLSILKQLDLKLSDLSHLI